LAVSVGLAEVVVKVLLAVDISGVCLSTTWEGQQELISCATGSLVLEKEQETTLTGLFVGLFVRMFTSAIQLRACFLIMM